MLRKIIAGTAVAGALTFGAAGIAGAATPTTPSPGSDGSSGANLSTLCAKLPQLQSKVQQLESKVNARIPDAQALEAKAKAAGHTKLANAIANRITRVQARESKLNTRLSKLEAKCGSTSSSSSTGA